MRRVQPRSAKHEQIEIAIVVVISVHDIETAHESVEASLEGSV